MGMLWVYHYCLVSHYQPRSAENKMNGCNAFTATIAPSSATER
jgi:hypothetical protein